MLYCASLNQYATEKLLMLQCVPHCLSAASFNSTGVVSKGKEDLSEEFVSAAVTDLTPV